MFKGYANLAAREDIKYRAQKEGDEPCPQCGRYRDLTEKCWWCGDQPSQKEIGYEDWPGLIEANEYSLQKIDDIEMNGKTYIRYEAVANDPNDVINGDDFLLSPEAVYHRPVNYTGGKTTLGPMEEVAANDGSVEGAVEIIQNMLNA